MQLTALLLSSFLFHIPELVPHVCGWAERAAGVEHVEAVSVKGAGPKPARCALTMQYKGTAPLHPHFLDHVLRVAKDHLPPRSKRRLRAQRSSAARLCPTATCGAVRAEAELRSRLLLLLLPAEPPRVAHSRAWERRR